VSSADVRVAALRNTCGINEIIPFFPKRTAQSLFFSFSFLYQKQSQKQSTLIPPPTGHQNTNTIINCVNEVLNEIFPPD